MNSYEFEYFYRYGEFEKEFDRVKIEDKTESGAFLQVRELRKWVFGIKLISINGINVEPCKQ